MTKKPVGEDTWTQEILEKFKDPLHTLSSSLLYLSFSISNDSIARSSSLSSHPNIKKAKKALGTRLQFTILQF